MNLIQHACCPWLNSKSQARQPREVTAIFVSGAKSTPFFGRVIAALHIYPSFFMVDTPAAIRADIVQ